MWRVWNAISKHLFLPKLQQFHLIRWSKIWWIITLLEWMWNSDSQLFNHKLIYIQRMLVYMEDPTQENLKRLVQRRGLLILIQIHFRAPWKHCFRHRIQQWVETVQPPKVWKAMKLQIKEQFQSSLILSRLNQVFLGILKITRRQEADKLKMKTGSFPKTQRNPSIFSVKSTFEKASKHLRVRCSRVN